MRIFAIRHRCKPSSLLATSSTWVIDHRWEFVFPFIRRSERNVVVLVRIIFLINLLDIIFTVVYWFMARFFSFSFIGLFLLLIALGIGWFGARQLNRSCVLAYSVVMTILVVFNLIGVIYVVYSLTWSMWAYGYDKVDLVEIFEVVIDGICLVVRIASVVVGFELAGMLRETVVVVHQEL